MFMSSQGLLQHVTHRADTRTAAYTRAMCCFTMGPTASVGWRASTSDTCTRRTSSCTKRCRKSAATRYRCVALAELFSLSVAETRSSFFQNLSKCCVARTIRSFFQTLRLLVFVEVTYFGLQKLIFFCLRTLRHCLFLRNRQYLLDELF